MPAIRAILVVPHTHHDIGYTHLPHLAHEGPRPEPAGVAANADQRARARYLLRSGGICSAPKTTLATCARVA